MGEGRSKAPEETVGETGKAAVGEVRGVKGRPANASRAKVRATEKGERGPDISIKHAAKAPRRQERKEIEVGEIPTA